MRRFLLALLALLIAASPVDAGTLLLLGAGVATPAAPAGFTGPGDVVSGATAWYSCSRGYSAAYSTGSNKGCNLRRASDNTTQDINILSNGNFDVASANTFAGIDATCQGSTTGLSVTIAFTSCSATPKAADTVTGSGISQPEFLTACGSFVGGAGSCTLTTAQNIGVAETVTMQVALFVTEAYDQSGNTNHVTQATAAKQPEWLPTCVNSVPCIYFQPVGAASVLTGNTSVVVPFTHSAVAERTGNTGGFSNITVFQNNNNQLGFGNAVNKIFLGNAVIVATASDNAFHAIQGVAATGATASVLNIDNTQTTGNTAPANGTGTIIGAFDSGGTAAMVGAQAEYGVWSSLAFSNTQQTNMCHNQFTYYATATSC